MYCQFTATCLVILSLSSTYIFVLGIPREQVMSHQHFSNSFLQLDTLGTTLLRQLPVMTIMLFDI